MSSSTPQMSEQKPEQRSDGKRRIYTHRAALQLALGYGVISVLWITFSSYLVELLSPDRSVQAFLESAKGWLFVLASAAGLYYVVRRMFTTIEKTDDPLGNLERSEVNYRLLINAVDDMVYQDDSEGNQVFANAKARELEELDEGENAYQPWSRFIHPDDLATTKAEYERQLASGDVVVFQNRIVGKHGRVTWVSHRIRTLRDANGAVLGIFGIGRDITDYKRTEETLTIRAHQQEVIAQLGQSALANPDLDTLFKETTELVAKTLEADFCKVLELLPDGKELLLRAGTGWKDGYVGSAKVSADNSSQAGFTLHSTEPVIVTDLGAEPRFSVPTMLHEHNVVSSVSVIIPGHEKPFGVLGAHAAHRVDFTRDDAYFLQATANVLAAAIERDRAEHLLWDSEEKGRVIVSTAADGIITIDEQNIVRSFNPAAERLFGYTARDAIGENISKFISKPLDDTSGDAFGWLRNGGSFPLELAVSEMQIDGRRMFTYIARDITERVQATNAVGRHIRQLSILNRVLQVAAAPIGFERMLDALLIEICEVFNADAADIHLMDANVGLLYLLASRGLQLNDDQKYQHLSIEKSMRGAAIQKGHVVTFNAPLSPDLSISPEQAEKIKAIAITPIWAGGQLRGTLAVTLLNQRTFIEDELALLEGLGRGVGITIENARLYAEAQSYAETLKIKIEERTQELQKALIHAQGADRTKSALVSTVSHEMRTPLSSIIGFSNLIISRRPEMEKTLEYSVAINSEARRLSDLINDFLDLQRLESGREVFHYAEVDLADLTRDIIRKQQIDEDARHTIRLDVSPVPWVYADPNRLRQVILNMLSNALKYSPNGGEILISLWSAGDEVMFSIHDEGLGIAPEDMLRIFDHFYRGDAAERYRIRGTGLGLGLCREIILIHNGRIWGESPGLNQGATFTFALPNLNRDQGRRRKPGSSGAEDRPLIVNIEDDMNFANYLAERLDGEGFDTQVIHFKAATASYVGQVAPALIILDLLQGEEQSGWTVLNDLQRFPATRHIPVIVCSSLDAHEKAEEVGAAGFIQKPIDEAALIATIRKLTTNEDERRATKTE